MKLQTTKLRTKTWAQKAAERTQTTVDVLNDEYSAPLSKEFRYSISKDLVTFLVDLKRIETIRRELLKSEKLWDPEPGTRRWPVRGVGAGPGHITWPRLTVRDAALEALNNEGHQVMTRLNNCLSRSLTHPVLFSKRLQPIRMMRIWPTSEERILGMSIEEILDYFQHGLLGRFRLCNEPDCKRWFFAITNHQRYCTEACRIRHVAQSQSFKDKRARYMREKYRPQMKQLEESAKRLASKRKG